MRCQLYINSSDSAQHKNPYVLRHGKTHAHTHLLFTQACGVHQAVDGSVRALHSIKGCYPFLEIQLEHVLQQVKGSHKWYLWKGAWPYCIWKQSK